MNAPQDRRRSHEPGEQQDDQRNDTHVEPVAEADTAEQKSEMPNVVLDFVIDGAVTAVTSVFDGL